MKKHAKPSKHTIAQKRSRRPDNSGALSATDVEGRLPPLNAQEWSTGDERWFRPIKIPVSLRLDADIVAWFKKSGQGYQTRINRTLRKLMIQERKGKGRK